MNHLTHHQMKGTISMRRVCQIRLAAVGLSKSRSTFKRTECDIEYPPEIYFEVWRVQYSSQSSFICRAWAAWAPMPLTYISHLHKLRCLTGGERGWQRAKETASGEGWGRLVGAVSSSVGGFMSWLQYGAHKQDACMFAPCIYSCIQSEKR